MFDFWKEVIINDADRFEKVTNADGKTGLRVKRCADYLADCVVDNKVYKTDARPGTPASLNLNSIVSGTALRRAKFDLGLEVGQDSEFARPWSNFAKTFVVEYTSLAGLKAALVEACPAHIGSVVGDNLVLVDPKVTLNVYVEKYTAETTTTPESWNVDAEITADITTNVVPVGTGELILENLRFPTHVNTRVAAPNADEMPVAGAKYVQYAFEYAVPKRGFHGQGAVGQEITSVTHHVFYVHKDHEAVADAAFKILTKSADLTNGVATPGTAAKAKVEDIEVA